MRPKTIFAITPVLILALFVSTPIDGQHASSTARQAAAVTKFLSQLQRIFGRFSEADLQQVFQAAEPVRCPELVEGKGEWKPVAFFNDKRELGSWYHTTLDEVKTDLRVYTFKSVCKNPRSGVKVTTRFPIVESIEAYNSHRIHLQQIELNVNAPVNANFNTHLQSYSFDLPYMFLRERIDGARLYSLMPQTIADRQNYERNVIDHWDCKAVREEDVTYQFLICRTTLATMASLRRGLKRVPYGAAGYVILSDGKEGLANARYSFDETTEPAAGTSKPSPGPKP
jgi:hypothetical protein